MATAHRTGRPTRQASEQRTLVILRVAGEMFRERGYASTSIEQIAVAARVGKHTIYRRYSTKEALFLAVIRADFKHVLSTFGLELDEAHLHPIETLRDYCREVLRVVTDSWVTGLFRTAIAEAVRFPAMAEGVRDTIMNDSVQALHGFVVDAQRAGLIVDVDPAILIRTIIIAISGEAFVRALLGADDFPGGVSFDTHFDRTWDIIVPLIVRHPAE